VRLWDATTGKELAKLTGHKPEVYRVAFGPEGQAIFGSGDGTMHLWDLNTGKDAGVFTGHTGQVRNGVWEVESGKELKRIDTPNACCVAFSPDGKRIVFGDYTDMKVRVLDVATGKELFKYEGHRDGVTCVAFFPNGKRIVSTSYDGTAHIWRAPR
jgi:WD40 repeat protein